MAIQVTSKCIGCQACLLICPSRAIYRQGDKVTIAAHRCTECREQQFGPHCGHICPIENALLDHDLNALNPTGSLQPDAFELAELKTRQETIND